jgi:hypothetical protein
MGPASMSKDRPAPSEFDTLAEQARRIADHVMDRTVEPAPDILVGPVIWRLEENSDARRWYFIIGSGGSEGFRVDQINFNSDRRLADECRAAFHLELLQRNPIDAAAFSSVPPFLR